MKNIIEKEHIQQYTHLPLYAEEYSFPKMENFGSHSHEFVEIGITLSGSAIHQTTSGDELLTPGSYYMIPVGCAHNLLNLCDWHVLNLYFLPITLFYQLFSCIGDYSFLQNFILTFFINPNFEILHHKVSSTDLNSISLLNTSRITSANAFGDSFALAECYRTNINLNLLLLLCNIQVKDSKIPFSALDQRFYLITSIIFEHIAIPTSDLIVIIKEQLHLDPQYINRLVKKSCGLTLNTYIIQLKLEKSLALLHQGHSITSTAQEMGFYDHSHYYKYFQRYFGFSPSDYLSSIL